MEQSINFCLSLTSARHLKGGARRMDQVSCGHKGLTIADRSWPLSTGATKSTQREDLHPIDSIRTAAVHNKSRNIDLMPIVGVVNPEQCRAMSLPQVRQKHTTSQLDYISHSIRALVQCADADVPAVLKLMWCSCQCSSCCVGSWFKGCPVLGLRLRAFHCWSLNQCHLQ